MDKNQFKIKVETIKEIFNDTRKLKCLPCEEHLRLDDEITKKGDIFKTEDGEYVYLDIQIKDFTVDTLVDYIEIAEEIYETFKKRVNVYIICSDNVNVRVREDEIKSDADFRIKLAKTGYHPAESVLEFIKHKISNHEMLDMEDIEMLKNLPMMCDRKMRSHYRREAFRIINEIHY